VSLTLGLHLERLLEVSGIDTPFCSLRPRRRRSAQLDELSLDDKLIAYQE
jgi:hypothetical protein